MTRCGESSAVAGAVLSESRITILGSARSIWKYLLRHPHGDVKQAAGRRCLTLRKGPKREGPTGATGGENQKAVPRTENVPGGREQG